MSLCVCACGVSLGKYVCGLVVWFETLRREKKTHVLCRCVILCAKGSVWVEPLEHVFCVCVLVCVLSGQT